MEAYYYKGSTYRDMKDAPRAVDAFLRAAEIGKRCSNDTLNGRIYGQLASLLPFKDCIMKVWKLLNKLINII